MYKEDEGVNCPSDPMHPEPEHADELANSDPIVDDINSGSGISAGMIVAEDVIDGNAEGK